jgi:quinohemoprotein ethanol dehydrogenase
LHGAKQYRSGARADDVGAGANLNTEKDSLRAGAFAALAMALSVAAICSAGCGGSVSRSGQDEISGAASAGQGVNEARVLRADREPGNWLVHGRTYNEQRFSPLKLVNDQNVGQLGLTWFYDLDTRRGQEATPIVVDGVMYFTTAWSKVFALNAATGAPVWTRK